MEPTAIEAVTRSSSRARLSTETQILLGLVIGSVLGLIANGLSRVSPPTAPPGDTTTVAPHPLDSKPANGIDDRVDWFVTNITDTVGKVFLRLIFMVVLPLVFSALVLGIIGLGDVRALGRVGLRTLLVTGLLSGSAVLLGVGLVNLFQPGRALSEEARNQLNEQFAGDAAKAEENAKKAKSLKDALLDIIPENPLQEAVGALDGSSKGNGMLSVMFFALVFGIAVLHIDVEKQAFLTQFFEGLLDASMGVIRFAMLLAPYCVACLMFGLAARLGMDVLGMLIGFAGTVFLGLALHLLVVYSLVLRLLGRWSPWRFFPAIQEAMTTAFATSSSNATLPTAMRVADERLGLPKSIAHFVLTIGSTGNQNGTALYEGVVVLFLAQLFGVSLDLGQQFLVVLLCVLAGIGTAGVPGGSIPMIVVILNSIGVPGAGIAIILGIDRLLDMCRTVLNVVGDLVVAVCVTTMSQGDISTATLPAAQPDSAPVA